VSCSSDKKQTPPDEGPVDSGVPEGSAKEASPPPQDGPILPDSAARKWTLGKGGKPGATTQELEVSGKKHIFAVHVPPSYDERQAVPLLLHFHGWRPAPAGIEDEIKYVWAPTANTNNFIAVAPEGLPCPDLSNYACFEETRDGPFVNALVDYLGQNYNIDLSRLYLSGHSGGSFFVQGYGLANAERYAAAAEFSGGCIKASDQYGNSCSVYDSISKAAKRKLPLFAIHNPNDQVVPVSYSAELLKILKANGHPTNAIDKYNGGSSGHSIDPSVVPDVWTWISGFTLP
jgi:poly(3-hydroxybutyrate) depolymerase